MSENLVANLCRYLLQRRQQGLTCVFVFSPEN